MPQAERGDNREVTMAIIPFDDRDGVIWMDGKVIPWRDAKIHVLSHGLHYGSCVFEGERAYDGVIFKSTEHSVRFRKSAELMDFEIPYSVEELNAAKDEVVRLSGGGDQYVRPVAFRGSEMMAVSAQNSDDPCRDRLLALAVLFQPGGKAQGHPSRHLALEAPRARYRAGACQGRRPLHDLHHLQA
jgi:branched-subunit amino acid aminotransferase/4-amino-4-deoxychorismate lyase